MDRNKIITVHIYNDEIRAVIFKTETAYAKILKTKMTHTTKLGQRIIKDEIIPYIQKGELCLMPRFMPYCLSLQDEYKIIYKNIYNYIDVPCSAKGVYKGEISENKLQLLPRIVDQLDTIGGITLKLNTGKGKSVVLSYLTYQYWKHSVWVAYTTTLQDQLREEAELRLGDQVNIVLIGGNGKKSTKQVLKSQESDEEMVKLLGDKPTIFICVYMSARKLNSIFWKYIYFIVFDESHCYCNSTGANIIRNCKVPKIIGLSATPDYDWRSNLAQYWCGPMLDGDKYIPDRDLKGKVSIISYYGQKMYTEAQRDANGKCSVTLMVKLLSEDPKRNELILTNIVSLLDDGHVVMVFSCRIDMLEKLNNMLIDRLNNPEIKCGLLVGKVSNELQREIKKSYNVIFTNYMFTRVGVNIPRATAMVLASPYKENGKQINGRILRSDDPIVRRYIDIVDENTYLKRQLINRKVDYVARKFELEYLKY